VLAWVALGAVLGAVAGWNLRPERAVAQLGPDPTVIARRAAIAHATYSPEVRHPVEVGADDEKHLLAWLSKRLGVKLRAPNLDEAGMSLVGGRLLPGDSGPVAQFMYQTQNGRRLTLYVRTEATRNRETQMRYARENNVGVFYWIDHDVGYALASADLSRDELLRLADLVYKKLEP
jgi:anti-sigma factor RsiW